MKVHKFFFLVLLSFFLSCNSEQPSSSEDGGQVAQSSSFELLDSNSTGVTFRNNVQDNNDFNILTYRNFYNGGGVAIGDINNDDLPDLYFTSNMEGNQLYLNKGDFKFENITSSAQVAGSKSWCTGVAMADVNGDGLLDIYVSNSGDIAGDNKQNELFINNGDLTFTEKAVAYGLDNRGFSTQASFFDYDQDGDLDCYLLNNSFKDPKKIELYRSMRDIPDDLGGDKLLRNDGEKFVDVSAEAGIYSSVIGFGLGACVGDVNGDMLADIYVSNDFWERDYLYINEGNGKFSEDLIERINFCPISSMGGDIADLNNDGHPDILSTDMLAGDNYRLKAMSAFDPYHLEDLKYRANYHYQIGQNCLQLNDGNGSFQEIAMLSGVAATDWSWGALAFDFDNDGNKDIFVSNGIQRDLMYMDFRDFMQDQGMYTKMSKEEQIDFVKLINQMPSHPLANYAFTNQKNLGFRNEAKDLGLDQVSFSNGSAYGDLDNDGDMDLVVNNSNMPAFIYENKAEQTSNRFLKLDFEGTKKNPFGIGSKVTIHVGGGIQSLQNFNTRGFQSSVEPNLVFGLADDPTIDSLVVIWPDLRKQVMYDVEVNQTLTLRHSDAKDVYTANPKSSASFKEVGASKLKGNTLHKENLYNDFDHELLLINMLSQETPRLVRGDVNNDGLEDFVVLGAKNDEDKLFLQTSSGAFSQKAVPHFKGTSEFESGSGALYDGDGDGDLDLMLGAGGNEYQDGGKYFILRYFVNDGRGNFVVDNSNIPQIIGNFSCIEASDFDGDGDMDLFLGARVVPGNYGLPPRSYLLENDNGTWKEATSEALAGAGMVTDAAWSDLDGDGDEDLVVVGDWMEVQVFLNQKGIFSNPIKIENSSGWWNRIEPADLDGDGDLDFVLGNRGTNTKFTASPERPLSMHVNDFDTNGKSEFVINWYPPLDEKAYPFASKTDLTAQIPSLKKQILRYEDYAHKTYETLFSEEVKSAASTYSAVQLASCILWNKDGNYTLEELPKSAQVSPAFGLAIADLTGNGQKDIWLGGNLYALQPQVGRHDASRGVLLEGQGDGRFEEKTNSGIYVEGEVRDAVVVKTGGKQSLIVARNNERLLMFQKD